MEKNAYRDNDILLLLLRLIHGARSDTNPERPRFHTIFNHRNDLLALQ